jgi:lysophospholipase L1-like esterase
MRLRKRSVGIGLLALGALASVALNVWLAHELAVAFGKLQWARIFPLGYASALSGPPLSPAAAEQGPVLALYGDSRMLEWPLAALPGKPAVANLAHGGTTSSQVLLQLQTQPVLPSTWAVLEVGINDLHPLGGLAEDRDLVRAELGANLRRCLQLLKARSRFVVVLTIFPPAHVPAMRSLFWDRATLAYIEEANQVILQMAALPQVSVIDANQLLRGADGYLNQHYADRDFFLHVNQAAYATLNAALAVEFERQSRTAGDAGG